MEDGGHGRLLGTNNCFSRAAAFASAASLPHGAGAHCTAAYKLVARDGVADASSLRQHYHRLALTGNQYRVNRKLTGRFVGSATG
jgi:hypothetical protein